jgi:glycosyltransferase involved in cell wall biosynthesis
VNDAPLVSIVIPNYNYAASVGLCVSACRAQTYRNVEVIVVDDGSTDASVAVAEAAGAQVIHSPVNAGVAAARNLGAGHARGEILMFIDSDVMPEPDAVAHAVALLSDHPEIGAVSGTYAPEPLIVDSRIEEYRCLHQYFLLDAEEGPIPTVHTAICAIRAGVFAELGGFNPRLRQTEDQDFGLRLSQRYPVYSSRAVRGKHDNDADLRVMLYKVFVRAKLAVPLLVDRRGLPGGYAGRDRANATALALAAGLTLPLPVLAGAWWAMLPPMLLAGSLACERAMYRMVVQRRGWRFLPFFAAMNTVVNVTTAGAIATGLLHWLLSPRFRALYAPARTDRAGTPA